MEGSIHVTLMDYRKCSHSLAGTDHAVPEARPAIAYKSTSRDRSSHISRYICPRQCHCFTAVGKRESESRMEMSMINRKVPASWRFLVDNTSTYHRV